MSFFINNTVDPDIVPELTTEERSLLADFTSKLKATDRVSRTDLQSLNVGLSVENRISVNINRLSGTPSRTGVSEVNLAVASLLERAGSDNLCLRSDVLDTGYRLCGEVMVAGMHLDRVSPPLDKLAKLVADNKELIHYCYEELVNIADIPITEFDISQYTHLRKIGMSEIAVNKLESIVARKPLLLRLSMFMDPEFDPVCMESRLVLTPITIRSLLYIYRTRDKLSAICRTAVSDIQTLLRDSRISVAGTRSLNNKLTEALSPWLDEDSVAIQEVFAWYNFK